MAGGVANKVQATAPKPGALRLPDRHHVPAITGAAQRINLTHKSGRELLKACPQPWQDESWAFFGVLPEVAFAAGFLGNSMSRVRWFPAVQTDPDEPPVPVEDASEAIPADLAAAAREELARITNGRDGLPGIKRGLGVNLAVAGEAYLIGRTDPDQDPDDDGGDLDGGEPGETWGVYSAAAITVRGNDTYLQEQPRGPKIKLAEDDVVVRIWRRDPQWPGWAWSNMKASLDTCEELLLHSRALRAIAKSATNGGILLMPTELDPPEQPRADPNDPDRVDPAAAGAGEQQTKLEREFWEWMTAAVEDDGSPTQIAPGLLRGGADYLEKVRLVQFQRQIDDKLVERIDHLIDRLAHGMDLPVEILKGVGSVNHWTGWLLQDETYKAHVQPTDEVAAQGVAYGMLRPALIERGFARHLVNRVVIGLDPSGLVVRPNRAADAKDAHAAGVIGDGTLRSEMGWTDNDAPTKDEKLERWMLRRGPATADMTAAVMEATGLVPAGVLPEEPGVRGDSPDEEADGEGPIEVGDRHDPVEGGEPTPDTLAAAAAIRANGNGVHGAPLAVAAANLNPYRQLGSRLHGIEVRLRERLVTASSAAVNDAIRVAGSRLRGAAQGNPELREQVNGQPAEEVAAILGPAIAAEVIADPDQLLAGAFDGLAAQWDSWVGQAQTDIAAAFVALVPDAPDPLSAAAAVETWGASHDESREAGWVALAAALLTVTRSRMFAAADQIAVGETDPSVAVPHGAVRGALARVGGADPQVLPSGAAENAGPPGLTTGPDVLGLLGQVGARVDGWRWSVGMPMYPFEPHQALEGIEFSSWEDPRLLNGGTFPKVGFFKPGDHEGCQCSTEPVLVPVVEAAQSQQEVAA